MRKEERLVEVERLIGSVEDGDGGRKEGNLEKLEELEGTMIGLEKLGSSVRSSKKKREGKKKK